MQHDPRLYAPPPGLCESCANVKIVETRKGSRFFLCQLSEVDPRFPKYPRLPVVACPGYRPAARDEVLEDAAEVLSED
ncbi:MAG TPA: hypothetical protein VHG91_15710 [Longimicrobium sp.]|nr:hypothetical protein [Longimicrobium sp.]